MTRYKDISPSNHCRATCPFATNVFCYCAINEGLGLNTWSIFWMQGFGILVTPDRLSFYLQKWYICNFKFARRNTDQCIYSLLAIYQADDLIEWLGISLECKGTQAFISDAQIVIILKASLIARFMGPTWGPSGADRTQVGPMMAPWTLLSGMVCKFKKECFAYFSNVLIKFVTSKEYVKAIKTCIRPTDCIKWNYNWNRLISMAWNVVYHTIWTSRIMREMVEWTQNLLFKIAHIQ